jgi:hypothetical protein
MRRPIETAGIIGRARPLRVPQVSETATSCYSNTDAVPPAGLEPAHPVPETGALSPELRERAGSDGTPSGGQRRNGMYPLRRMSDPRQTRDDDGNRAQSVWAAGAGVALGVGVGAAIFAATGVVIWDAIGPALGVAFGSIEQD